MERLPTTLNGPVFVAPRVIRDERGFFCETYRRNEFADLGVSDELLQDNHSRSSYGVVRGMHFQVGAGAAKLVRCARGRIYDVLVDLRKGSPTFGHWEGFDLSDENMHMVFCPIGFAHGFCVVSEVADVIYKQSNYYSDATERGLAYNDPEVDIRWPVPEVDLRPSKRDATASTLSELMPELPFQYLANAP